MTALSMTLSRRKSIGIWALRVLVALTFLLAAAMKLTGQPMMVVEFQQVGLGQWFRYFTGALELAGGIAILVPSVSAFAAVVLLALDVGAFITQIAVLHGDWIHTVVIGAILSAAIYLQRDRFGSRA